MLSPMNGISTAGTLTIQERTLRSYFRKERIYSKLVTLILIKNYYLFYCPVSSHIPVFVCPILVGWRLRSGSVKNLSKFCLDKLFIIFSYDQYQFCSLDRLVSLLQLHTAFRELHLHCAFLGQNETF